MKNASNAELLMSLWTLNFSMSSKTNATFFRKTKGISVLLIAFVSVNFKIGVMGSFLISRSLDSTSFHFSSGTLSTRLLPGTKKLGMFLC